MLFYPTTTNVSQTDVEMRGWCCQEGKFWSNPHCVDGWTHLCFTVSVPLSVVSVGAVSLAAQLSDDCTAPYLLTDSTELGLDHHTT